MKLRIVNSGISYFGSSETPDLFIDGITAQLVIITGPGIGGLIDGIAGANWTPGAGSTMILTWPPVYVNGKPVRYNQRIRFVSKATGILSQVYLDE